MLSGPPAESGGRPGPPPGANRRAADELARQILAHDQVLSADDLSRDIGALAAHADRVGVATTWGQR